MYLHNYEDLNLNVPQTNSSVMNAIRGLNSKQISPAVLPIPEDYPDHHSREPSWRGSPGHSIPEEDEESCYDSGKRFFIPHKITANAVSMQPRYFKRKGNNHRWAS